MVRTAVTLRAFQSTPSGGKATNIETIARLFADVSIHAFRGEGDSVASASRSRSAKFQSTPSGGKATFCQCDQAR